MELLIKCNIIFKCDIKTDNVRHTQKLKKYVNIKKIYELPITLKKREEERERESERLG